HAGGWFLRYADYRHPRRLYRRESHLERSRPAHQSLGRHRRVVRRRHARQCLEDRIPWLARQFDRGLDRCGPRIVDLAEHQGPRHNVSWESAAIATLLEGSDELKARPRHPEKARLPDTPVLPKPAWIRVRAPGAHAFDRTRDVLRAHRLVTVC